MPGDKRSSERRIEIHLLRDTPGQEFMSAEEAVRDAVLDFVGIRDEIGFIDHDRLAKLIHSRHIAVFERRLKEMPPVPVVLLELRAGDLHRVIEETAIERLP